MPLLLLRRRCRRHREQSTSVLELIRSRIRPKCTSAAFTEHSISLATRRKVLWHIFEIDRETQRPRNAFAADRVHTPSSFGPLCLISIIFDRCNRLGRRRRCLHWPRFHSFPMSGLARCHGDVDTAPASSHHWSWFCDRQEVQGRELFWWVF